MRNGHRVISMALLITVLQTITTMAETPTDHTATQILTLPGAIHAVLPADLNADSRCDLLFSCTAPHRPGHRRRRILVAALQQADGHFKQSAPQSVPENAIAFDLLGAQDSTAARLIYLRTRGLTLHEWDSQNSRFSVLPLVGTHLNSALPVADANVLPASSLHCPLWPGRFKITTATGLDIYRLDGQQLFRESRFQSPPLADISDRAQRVTLHAPRLFWGKLNEDTIVDGFIVCATRLHVYLRGQKSVPNGRPPHFTYHFDDTPLHPSILTQLGPSKQQMQLADLNGDSLTDLIRLRAPGARFTTDVSQIRIHFNRSGRWNKTPDQILTAEYFTGEAAMIDMNHDDRTDLVLTHFSTGLGQALRYLLTKRVKVSCHVHLMQPEGRYADQPDSKFSFTRSVALERLLAQSETHHQISQINGDALPDLLAATQDNQWTLFPGDSVNGFTQSHKITLQAPGESRLLIHPLDDTGHADLLFWMPGDATRNRVQLFLNPGGQP